MSESKYQTVQCIGLALLPIVALSLMFITFTGLFGGATIDGLTQTALLTNLPVLWHTYGVFAAATFYALTTDYLYFCVFIIASAVIRYTDTFCNNHIDYIEIGDSVLIKALLG